MAYSFHLWPEPPPAGDAKSVGAAQDSTEVSNDAYQQNEQYLTRLQSTDPPLWNKLRAQDILEAQKSLATIGYGTMFTAALEERTIAALRNYQTRSGIPVSGDVDLATLQQLARDKSQLEPKIPLGPVYRFDDANWKDFVKVEGIWLEQGKETDANTPVLSAVLECYKTAGLCALATVGSQRSEYIRLEWYSIQRWDEYEIVTEPDDLPCGRETMHINRPGKSMLVINTAAYKNEAACMNLFGPPSAETVSRLGDPSKIRDARLAAFRAASKQIYLISPEARSRVTP